MFIKTWGVIMLVALVLASGKGTRLSPLSNKDVPKQYLKVITGKTLIEDTIDRINSFIPNENIFVTTNILQKDLAFESLSFLREENIIFEPEMKETLASITHAISYIKKLKGNNITYLVLPSDHYIEPKETFLKTIKDGYELISNYNNFLLFGLKPSYPSTEFGYIESEVRDNLNFVKSFIEKPPYDRALELFKKNNYYWNNFIMLLKQDLVFNALEEILPEQAKLMANYVNGLIDSREFFANTYVDNFSRSILEKQKNMLLFPVDYTWFDIGNFESLFKVLTYLKKEEQIKEIKEVIKKAV